jgi:glycosyltransferase involved in cell wall biosynthesis
MCLDSVCSSRLVDELLVFVDSKTTDETAAIARLYTQNVFPIDIEVHGVIEPLAQSVGRRCSGDLVLRLDDDETLNGNWDPDQLWKLIENLSVTHFYTIRRWLIPPGNSFIQSPPWFPDFQVRLYRNIPGIVTWPKALHDPITVEGAGLVIMNGWIDHHVLTLLSRRERESKCARYRNARPDYDLSPYYLFEDSPVLSSPANPNDFLNSIRLSERLVASWPCSAIRPHWLRSFM